MKCFVCGCEFPDDKKFCPGCGRIITQRDREKSAKINTYSNSRQNTGAGYQKPDAGKPAERTGGKSSVYRPAASSSSRQSDIKSIFNSDPNAPEYSDPHSYDRATADVLEYDRMYMQQSRNSGSSGYSDNKNRYEPKYDTQRYNTYESEPEDAYASQEPPYEIYREDYDDNENIFNDDENLFDEAYYPDERQTKRPSKAPAKEEKRNAKPHINISGKAIAVAAAVILGIIICVTGIYQIGKQFGIWGERSTGQDNSGEIITEEDTSKEDVSKESANSENENGGSSTSYKTGIYTVKTDGKTIFMYKSETERTVIATIPNKTVIEITEIVDDGNDNAEEDENAAVNYYGKTTYNSFTGWIDMEDAEYTPDAKVSETTTAPAQNDSDNGNNDSNNSNDDNENGDENNNSDTQQTPGEYTVTLNGQGNAVNVRSDHSTDGDVITTLPEGTKVTVDEVQSGWGHVVLDEGEGWIYMQYLK